MRIVWLSLLATLALVHVAHPRDRISLDTKLDDSAHIITGQVTVVWHSIDSSFADPHFRLWANYLAGQYAADSGISCGTIVESVLVNGLPVADTPTVHGSDWSLPLAGSQLVDSLTISLWFTTSIPPKPNRFGYFDGRFYLDGWFPMPAPHRDGHWLVVTYDQDAELVGDFYDFEVSMDHRRELLCLAPGKVRSDTLDTRVIDHFRLSPAHDFACLLGPKFKQRSFATDSTTVSFYYQSRDEEAIDSTAQSVLYTIRWMAQHVGPYPFKELLVVETPLGIGGGVEFPQMYWQSGLSTGEYSRIQRTVAIHETVHQWFYGILASNQAEEPWLDESITEYFTEEISRAEANGRPDFVNGVGISATSCSDSRLTGHYYLEKLPITRASAGYTRKEYFPVIYGKGPMIVRTAVKLLGNQEDQFWQQYYQQFCFHHPSQSDFVALLNLFPPYSTRLDAGNLINNSALVDYVVDEFSNKRADSGAGYKSSISVTAYNPLPYPVLLRVEFLTLEPLDTLIQLAQGQQEVLIQRSEPVSAVNLDPERQIAIDVDYLNNSLRQSGSGAAFRLFSGITFLVESLFSLVWGI